MNKSSNEESAWVRRQSAPACSERRPQQDPDTADPRTTVPWACLLITGLVLVQALIPARAADAQPDDWQLRRLMSPTPSERASERQGRVFIYDGLERQDVNRALDEHFGRIESMMFIRTRVPSPAEPEVTHVEEDGC